MATIVDAGERRVLRRFHIKPGPRRTLAEVVRVGLPTRNAREFLAWAAAALPMEKLIKAAGISKRTLERRTAKRLSPAQSDRLARIASVIDFAEASIGTASQAFAWLNAPNQALRGAVPVELLDTDAGARRVETVLGRLREGSIA